MWGEGLNHRKSAECEQRTEQVKNSLLIHCYSLLCSVLRKSRISLSDWGRWTWANLSFVRRLLVWKIHCSAENVRPEISALQSSTELGFYKTMTIAPNHVVMFSIPFIGPVCLIFGRDGLPPKASIFVDLRT